MVCLKCGAEMKQRTGKFGDFWGCSKFPKCKNTVNIPDGNTPREEPEENINTNTDGTPSIHSLFTVYPPNLD